MLYNITLPIKSSPLPVVAVIAALVLSACTNTTQPADQLPPPTDCGASLLQEKIGLPVAGSSAADATVAGVLVRSKGEVRVIAPGTIVIQNFVETRLSLETDGSGNLVSATCG